MKHLSSTQISESILGERSVEAEGHLKTCGMCREEVVRLQDGLRSFRQSVHSLAEGMDSPDNYNVPRIQAIPNHTWRWAAAAAMAMTLALLPLYLDNTQARPGVDSADDALVLTRVRARLSQSVPQPMQQLMNLMNGEGEPEAQR